MKNTRFKALLNKNVLLGVSGGIAAYKSAFLVRRLREEGAEVRVVMTRSSKEFITPLTLQAVSGHPVFDDLFDPRLESGMGHIELARWADLILVAPATADFIARLSYGRADDLLTTLCLATRSKIAIAPAMNQQMYEDAITQENINKLKAQGIEFFGPGFGEQACGEYGPGRMTEPEELVQFAAGLFKTGALAGQKVLITAGPTHEPIDPIRFLTNRSSGKMGYALAQAAVEAGAEVTLVSGPVNLKVPNHVNIISVTTAEEMYQTVMKAIKDYSIFMGVAAVSDYRIAVQAQHKIPRDQETLTLELVRNPDILSSIAALKNPPFTVGFAAQTENVIEHAKKKLTEKRIDLMVANDVSKEGQGFESDHNAVTVLWKDHQKEFPLSTKHHLARELIQLIAERFHEKNPT